MPRCEGRPEGACPARRNDDGVRHTQGELMLCEDCDRYRFPVAYATAGGNLRSAKSKSGKQSSAQKATAKEDVSVSKPAARTESVSSDRSQGEDQARLSAQPETRRIVVNELLSYMGFYRDRSSQPMLLKVMIGFYSSGEISAAKKCLINEFHESLADTAFLTERRGSSTRPASEAELEDVLGTLAYLDSKNVLSSVMFGATDLSRLPGYAPEETNICAVADRQRQMSATMNQLEEAVHSLLKPATVSALEPVDQHFRESVSSIQLKLDELAKVVKGLRCNSTTATTTTGAKAAGVEQSREKNIVVFGIPESRDSSEWRAKLTEALCYTAGRDVPVSDAFRIGKFSHDKARPLIVKLQSVWDRRIILSNSRTLANAGDDMRRIFIVADMPLEERRKKTLKRLHDKAVRDNRNAVVSANGASLVVDGVVTFTVKDGYVLNNAPDSAHGE